MNAKPDLDCVVYSERDIFAEHRRIFEATIARDSAAATKAIAEHLRLTAEIIVASLKLDEQRSEASRQAAAQ